MEYRWILGLLATMLLSTYADASDIIYYSGDQYKVAPGGISTTAADFDGDGLKDLAVACDGWGEDDPDSVSILKNNGDGTFKEKKSFSLNQNIYHEGAVDRGYTIYAADFDRDKDMDIGVFVFYPPRIIVLKNDGHGVFPQVTTTSVGAAPASFCFGDFNNDGACDLAIGDNDPWSNDKTSKLYIYVNDGTGSFQLGDTFPLDNSPRSAFACDFDKDGNIDIAIAKRDYLGSGAIDIFKGNGDGHFQSGQRAFGPGNAEPIVFGDLDGDGNVDLAYGGETTLGSQFIAVSKNDGVGNFGPGQKVTDGDKFIFCDWDGDGVKELSITKKGIHTYNWVPGSVLPTEVQNNLRSTAYPYSICTADFDGDQDDDFAVIGGNEYGYPANRFGSGESEYSIIEVFLNCGGNYDFGGPVTSVFSSDFDGDGDNDLAVACSTPPCIKIALNNGNGIFAFPSSISLEREHKGLSLSDFVKVTVTTSGGSTNSGLAPSEESKPIEVSGEDLNGDGKCDLAALNQSEKRIFILVGDGKGNFSKNGEIKVKLKSESERMNIGLADLDRNGSLDICLTGGLNENVQILKNNGRGGFETKMECPAGKYPWQTAIADYDKDGDNDIAVVNSGSDDVSILYNNGDCTFKPAISYPIPRHPTGFNPRYASIIAVDLNKDGFDDLVASKKDADSVAFLINNKDGTFRTIIAYAGSSCQGEGYLPLCSGNFSSLTDSSQIAVGAPVSTDLYNAYICHLDSSYQTSQGNTKFYLTYDMYPGVGSPIISAIDSDFDSDGLSDIAICKKHSNFVTIYTKLDKHHYGPNLLIDEVK